MFRPTSIDVCNLALSHVRGQAIQAFEERSNEAVQCKRFYQPALYATLEALDWGFARAYDLATQYAGLPKGIWTHAYVYPEDALKVRGFTNDMDVRPYARFEVGVIPSTNQRVIYTDLAAPLVVYTRAIDNPAYFSPQFYMAFSHLLAAYLAAPIGRPELAKQQLDIYSRQILEAAASDLNEGIHDNVFEPRDPDWIEAR